MEADSNRLERELAETAARVPEFTGLSQPEAEALATRLGLRLRVITTDDQFVTADLQTHRMTILVDKGTVTNAFAG